MRRYPARIGGMGPSVPKPNFQWVSGQLGSVPPNAVRAGVDSDGQTIFVGRAFHNGDMLPAKIITSHRGAYVPWGGGEHKKDQYEVLCAPQVSWMSASNGTVPRGAVPIGNTKHGESLYIGRVLHNGALTPGKIQPSHHVCYIPYGGKELSFREYEALVIH